MFISLYRGLFSSAPGCARYGLVATPRLPREVPRGVRFWTGSTVDATDACYCLQ